MSDQTRPDNQQPQGFTSSYLDASETAWARRWPMENVWKLRKAS